MGLSIGIVGLPNVGKSTLFNALSSAKAEAANYPFCTIEPNVGVVAVPDPRLQALDSIVHAEKIVPTAINFVDIAGLVRGASKGEGLGNQFLSHIRECDAIVQVARCFEDGNVIHVENRVDPVSDIATVTTELCLKDLDTVNKRLDRARKAAKGNIPLEKLAFELCEALGKHLDAGQPARTFKLPDAADAALILRDMQLLTAKPAFYVANVDEPTLANLEGNAHFVALRNLARSEGAPIVPVGRGSRSPDRRAGPERAGRLPGERRAEGAGAPRHHSRRLRAARAADLLHRRQDGGPRLDHGPRRPRSAGRRGHPHRLRERLHQSRSHLVGRTS